MANAYPLLRMFISLLMVSKTVINHTFMKLSESYFMNMLAICIPCSSIHHCLSARTVPFAKLFTNETLCQLHIPTAAAAKPAQQSLRQLCNASSVDGTVATI
jgi:hypothetical protein